jgi:polysaccharide biosynthesis/export protein
MPYNYRFRYIHLLLFPVLIYLLTVSCSTPLREVTYLHGIDTGTKSESGPKPEEYLIRPNDQLFIQVISDDPLNAAFLNLVNAQGNAGNLGNSANSLELITFLVDEQGSISYPQLGEIHVEGLTTGGVRDIIQKKVNTYLESASVFVKLVNRNITVLGEVRNPGQKLMVKNQLTIFEALGTAGDITDYGNRRNVKLIRELPDGKHVAELDLTNPKLLSSPYYYVLPHDVVYVEYSTKIYGAKNLSYAAPISITASVISIGLLVLNLFKN